MKEPLWGPLLERAPRRRPSGEERNGEQSNDTWVEKTTWIPRVFHVTMFRPTLSKWVEAEPVQIRDGPGPTRPLSRQLGVRSLKDLPLEDPRGQRVVPDPDKAFNAILGRCAY